MTSDNRDVETPRIWGNYHVYYTNLQPLILDCVYPLLQRVDNRLRNSFWERHYAGGPHLRVRLFGSASAVDLAAAELVADVNRFVSANPSVPLSNYSEEKVRSMLQAEDEDVDSEDLTYRVDQIQARPYERLNHRLASDEAARLLEDFLHDSMTVVASILRSRRPLREEILRLYFAHALLVAKEIPPGCVAYKSHWEGFACLLPTRGIITRIQEQYIRDRNHIREIMINVQRAYELERFAHDPVLTEWASLIRKYRERTKLILQGGQHVTRQAASTEEVRATRSKITKQTVAESEFIRTLFRDERFMALIQFDHNFLWPRVLINLLYQVVAAAGLPLIEKMSMCYYAHRAAEDHWNCDLTRMLEETIQCVISQHGSRLSGQ